MTKLIPALCAFALFAPHGLRAAAAYPSAASNYVFTTPLRPAHIRGLVMGSLPAYLTPRSEDYDWLNEALKERVALARPVEWLASTNAVLRPEFGKWNLSETNRFHRWVTAVDAAGATNVVVGYHLATNAPSSSRSPWALFGQDHYPTGEAAARLWNPAGTVDWRTGYLDPDAPLVTDAKLCRAATYTNIYSVAAYTNGWTNAFSTISITLADGTESVHTNSWAARRAFPATFTYTNVFESTPLDGCHAGGGPFPGYTNVPPLVRTWCSVPVAITNDYAALRGAVRLAEELHVPTNAPEKWVVNERQRGDAYTNDLYESIADIIPWHWTNSTTSVSTNLDYSDWCEYELSMLHSSRKTTVLYKETDSQGYVRIKSKDVTEYTISNTETKQFEDTAIFETRFPSDVVTTGGTMRVGVDAIYAAARFYYEDYCTTNYEDGASLLTNVVVRLSGSELDVSGSNTTARVLINSRAICEAAAQAAGVPAPPDVSGDPGAQRTKKWSISRLGFVFFYRTHPTSKIAGWE